MMPRKFDFWLTIVVNLVLLASYTWLLRQEHDRAERYRHLVETTMTTLNRANSVAATAVRELLVCTTTEVQLRRAMADVEKASHHRPAP